MAERSMAVDAGAVKGRLASDVSY